MSFLKSGLTSRKTGTKGRWELWARSAHNLIPVLKQQPEWSWRANKLLWLKKKKIEINLLPKEQAWFSPSFPHGKMRQFVWILVSKLAPLCYRKLNRLLIDTGRYHELPSWRNGFKEEWRKLEKKGLESNTQECICNIILSQFCRISQMKRIWYDLRVQSLSLSLRMGRSNCQSGDRNRDFKLAIEYRTQLNGRWTISFNIVIIIIGMPIYLWIYYNIHDFYLQ